MPATDTTEQEALVARASARHVRVTPMKARRVVDLIRGKDTQTAIATLQFAPQGAAEPTLKVLNSAIANLRVKADEAGEPFDERRHLLRRPVGRRGARDGRALARRPDTGLDRPGRAPGPRTPARSRDRVHRLTATQLDQVRTTLPAVDGDVDAGLRRRVEHLPRQAGPIWSWAGRRKQAELSGWERLVRAGHRHLLGSGGRDALLLSLNEPTALDR